MNSWPHRTLIVPDELVEYARALTLAVAGESARGMWTTPISNKAESITTHWITAGLIGEEFADIIPLMQYVEDENNDAAISTIMAGKPEICLHLATQSGFQTTMEGVIDLYTRCYIFEDDDNVIMQKMGFTIVNLGE